MITIELKPNNRPKKEGIYMLAFGKNGREYMAQVYRSCQNSRTLWVQYEDRYGKLRDITDALWSDKIGFKVTK